MNDEELTAKPTPREKVLYTAAKLTVGDRNKTHGEPFDNMGDIATLWEAYLSVLRRNREGYTNLRPSDVANLNTLQKMARSVKGVFNPDDYIDSAAYQAIAGECADREASSNAN